MRLNEVGESESGTEAAGRSVLSGSCAHCQFRPERCANPELRLPPISRSLLGIHITWSKDSKAYNMPQWK